MWWSRVACRWLPPRGRAPGTGCSAPGTGRCRQAGQPVAVAWAAAAAVVAAAAAGVGNWHSSSGRDVHGRRPAGRPPDPASQLR